VNGTANVNHDAKLQCGLGREKLDETIATLKAKGVKYDTIELERPRHAQEILTETDLTQYDAVVLVGGDGTFHEGANGIMRNKDWDKIKEKPLAMIPAGTGNSFALDLRGTTDAQPAIEALCEGKSVPIDIMKLTFSANGQPETLYAFNSIHWGLASQVVLTAEKMRWMGKAIRYTTAAIMELFRGNKQRARLTIESGDGTVEVIEDEFCLLIANNVYSTAKGMKMVPDAKLNDGLIDLLVVKSDSTLDLMNMFSKIYSGTHTDLPFVDYR